MNRDTDKDTNKDTEGHAAPQKDGYKRVVDEADTEGNKLNFRNNRVDEDADADTEGHLGPKYK